jgi:Fe2+ transport system protein FeoA
MSEHRLRPLSRLHAGQTARVASLGGGREFQARLVSMGLFVGSQVTVIRAGGGARGATLVALGPMRLGIGRGMAEKIMVAVEHRAAKEKELTADGLTTVEHEPSVHPKT